MQVFADMVQTANIPNVVITGGTESCSWLEQRCRSICDGVEVPIAVASASRTSVKGLTFVTVRDEEVVFTDEELRAGRRVVAL